MVELNETPPPRRSDLALGEPPDDLAAFPVTTPASTWFREHRHRQGDDDGGCWFFNGHAESELTGARFDLTLPAGTCYVGESEAVAARERCGRLLAARQPIPRSFTADRVVTTIDPPREFGQLADATNPDAATAFGVTRELCAANDYSLTSRWADALARAGHRGIRYEPRFGVDHECAVALFGPHGRRPEWPVVSSRPLSAVLDDLGIAQTPVPGAETRADDTLEP